MQHKAKILEESTSLEDLELVYNGLGPAGLRQCQGTVYATSHLSLPVLWLAQSLSEKFCQRRSTWHQRSTSRTLTAIDLSLPLGSASEPKHWHSACMAGLNVLGPVGATAIAGALTGA